MSDMMGNISSEKVIEEVISMKINEGSNISLDRRASSRKGVKNETI
jgi:hypothetical protein